MNSEEISQALANGIISYVNNRRDKKEEEFLKSKSKKNKLGMVVNGAIIERLLTFLKKMIMIKILLIILKNQKRQKINLRWIFKKIDTKA